MIRIPAGPVLMESIRMCVEARRPFIIEGPTGVGKSEIAEQCALQLGIRSIVIDLSLLEAPDLIGIPTIHDGRTMYAHPLFLPDDGAGLLIFEELNRAHRHVQAPVLQVLTTRRLNEYRLPDDWLPAACINPADDGYLVNELDTALIARSDVLRVHADVEHWLRWAGKHGVHEAVCSYVQATPRIFDAPLSNPRSWTYVSDMVKTFERGNYDVATLLNNIAGYVGDELAQAFLTMYQAPVADTPPSPDEILQNYKRVRRRVKDWAEAGNAAMLESTFKPLMALLQDPTHETLVQTDRNVHRNLRAFLKDLPADFRREFLSFHPWIAGNRKRMRASK